VESKGSEAFQLIFRGRTCAELTVRQAAIFSQISHTLTTGGLGIGLGFTYQDMITLGEVRFDRNFVKSDTCHLVNGVR